jgi:hypothetical protein
MVYVNNILQKLNLFYVYKKKKTLNKIRSIKICKKKLKSLEIFFFSDGGILLPCYRKDHHHILKRIRNLDR